MKHGGDPIQGYTRKMAATPAKYIKHRGDPIQSIYAIQRRPNRGYIWNTEATQYKVYTQYRGDPIEGTYGTQRRPNTKYIRNTEATQ